MWGFVHFWDFICTDVRWWRCCQRKKKRYRIRDIDLITTINWSVKIPIIFEKLIKLQGKLSSFIQLDDVHLLGSLLIFKQIYLFIHPSFHPLSNNLELASRFKRFRSTTSRKVNIARNRKICRLLSKPLSDKNWWHLHSLETIHSALTHLSMTSNILYLLFNRYKPTSIS